MKSILKYTLIAILFSCGNETNKELVEGVVTSSEWYVYSVGFSTKSASGFFKQRIKYSFIVDNKTHYGSFNNGPDIGPLFKGDSIIIEIAEGVVSSNRVVKRHKSTREKFPPVNSNSIKENAFDSAYVELLKRSHLPEVEIKE
jgi:hypothetical protein